MSYRTRTEETEGVLKIYREGKYEEGVENEEKKDLGAFMTYKESSFSNGLTAYFGYHSYEGNKEFARHIGMNVQEMIQMRNFLNKCLESYIKD